MARLFLRIKNNINIYTSKEVKKIENLYSYICKFYLKTAKKAIFKTFSINTGSYHGSILKSL